MIILFSLKIFINNVDRFLSKEKSSPTSPIVTGGKILKYFDRNILAKKIGRHKYHSFCGDHRKVKIYFYYQNLTILSTLISLYKHICQKVICKTAYVTTT